jgi:predicted metal-binding membrane protein
VSDRSRHTFVGVSALLFAASAAVTVVWCESMSAMGGMEMPGGWTMSMAWMRMPGQSWSGAATSFLGMWVVMMVAMMLPSLVPMLARYRWAACCRGGRRLGLVTMLAAGGYFAVWTAFGLIALLVGVALVTMTMQLPALSRAVPMASAVVVIIAGSLQFSRWKARHLACCRGVAVESGVAVANASRGGRNGVLIARAVAPWRNGVLIARAVAPWRNGVLIARAVTPWRNCVLIAGAVAPGRYGGPRAEIVTAWADGVRMGIHCVHCCAGLTVILLVMGVMDVRAMAMVAAAITVERLAPAGERVARIIGVIVVAAGLYLMVQAAGAGRGLAA